MFCAQAAGEPLVSIDAQFVLYKLLSTVECSWGQAVLCCGDYGWLPCFVSDQGMASDHLT
jgi:hypothetical protein